jgi:hypothetical protein
MCIRDRDRFTYGGHALLLEIGEEAIYGKSIANPIVSVAVF